MLNRDGLRARQAAQPLATPEYAVAAPGYPSGGPAGQSSRRKVRRACPSGGPAGQSYRRNVRRACPSGGPAGRSTKKGFRCNMLRCNSLYPVQETGETLARGCATPPARSQSARVTGDLSGSMRRASGALKGCAQRVKRRECKCWQSWQSGQDRSN